MTFEGFPMESDKERHNASVEIEDEYEAFVPAEFREDPVGYFEKEGKNIKSGEIKYDETGGVREDPTAVKDLPVWRDTGGHTLDTVARRVNVEKGEVGKSADPFYEYKILERLRKMGLPAAKPVAKAEQGGAHIIVMEKIPGIRWSEKDALRLRERGYSDEDVENLKRQAEEQMTELQRRFQEAGVKRGWKLKDMVFDIDIEGKRVRSIIPTDWERTRIE